MKIVIIGLMLSGLAAAQPAPSMQLQGRHGSVNLGFGADGRPIMDASGRHGSVSIPGGVNSVGSFRSGDWKNATLTRGAQGELILSDPEQGTITMERGPVGKTYIQTREGNFTVDNSMLQQLLQGQDPLQMQLQGR